MQPVKSAKENVPPQLSAGKSATAVKRGKKCHRCKARENMQQELSTESKTGTIG